MPCVVLEDVRSLKQYVGREIGLSGWLSVTQERIDQFAQVTEDRQWIHIDRERASRESPFGSTVAHGFLTLSLVSYLVREVLEIRGGMRLAVNYGLNRVRFPSPVFPGSKIRIRVSVSVLKESPETVEATFSVAIETENSDKPACVAEWLVHYYC